MLSILRHPQVEAEEAGPGDVGIKIVIGADDANGGARARELSERLARELKPGMRISSEIWRFNFLRHDDVRNVAAASAAEADLIAIAVHDDGELPKHVKLWIEDWVPLARSGSTALLALVDHCTEIPGNYPSLCAYLRRVARRAGMDFYLMTGPGMQGDFDHIATDESEPGESSDDALNIAESRVLQRRVAIPGRAENLFFNYANNDAA